MSVQCLRKNGSKAELRNNVVIFFVIHPHACSLTLFFLFEREIKALTEKKENFFFLERKSDCFVKKEREFAIKNVALIKFSKTNIYIFLLLLN